jgi:hypothetical protein
MARSRNRQSKRFSIGEKLVSRFRPLGHIAGATGAAEVVWIIAPAPRERDQVIELESLAQSGGAVPTLAALKDTNPE